MTRSTPCLTGLLALGLLAAGGCGGPARRGSVPVYPVQGTVTYKGEPVADAQVTFYPVDRGEGQKVPGAFGRTDGQGRFVLRTFGDADGAAAGEFVVLVTKTVDENPPVESTKIDAPRPEPKFKSLLPAHAGKPNTTPLRVTIPPSGSHSFAISLADDPKASTIQPAGGK